MGGGDAACISLGEHCIRTLTVISFRLCFSPFDAGPDVMNGILWSEQLDRIFMTNYESDPSLTWQYFGSSTGFMRQYPGMSDIPAARQYLCIVRMPMMFVVKPQMCLINLLGFYLLDTKKNSHQMGPG